MLHGTDISAGFCPCHASTCQGRCRHTGKRKHHMPEEMQALPAAPSSQIVLLSVLKDLVQSCQVDVHICYDAVQMPRSWQVFGVASPRVCVAS